jgi:hypothetical protein
MRTRGPGTLFAALLTVLSACGDGTTRIWETAELVSLDGWQPTPSEADPFNDHRSDPRICAGGFGAEEGVFEVETDVCPYATFTQPARITGPAGTCLQLRWWHLILSAPEPAEAHMAVQVGERILLEHQLPIPSGSATFEEIVPVVSDLPEGAPVFLHLHNHGANSWRFEPIRIIACPPNPSSERP